MRWRKKRDFDTYGLWVSFFFSSLGCSSCAGVDAKILCCIATFEHCLDLSICCCFLSAIIEFVFCVKMKCACHTLSQFVPSDLGLGFMYHTARLALNNTKPGIHSSVSTSLQASNEYSGVFLIQPENQI